MTTTSEQPPQMFLPQWMYRQIITEATKGSEQLRGVRLMLRTELKAYQREPWAQRVNEAYDATIEREGESQ